MSWSLSFIADLPVKSYEKYLDAVDAALCAISKIWVIFPLQCCIVGPGYFCSSHATKGVCHTVGFLGAEIIQVQLSCIESIWFSVINLSPRQWAEISVLVRPFAFTSTIIKSLGHMPVSCSTCLGAGEGESPRAEGKLLPTMVKPETFCRPLVHKSSFASSNINQPVLVYIPPDCARCCSHGRYIWQSV